MHSGGEKEKKVEVDSFASYSRREVRRREFNAACRTVGVFMAAYLGCCMPYLIWNALGKRSIFKLDDKNHQNMNN